MCSFQNSDANFGTLTNENWEEALWANVFSPNSNVSDTSTSNSQVSDVTPERNSSFGRNSNRPTEIIQQLGPTASQPSSSAGFKILQQYGTPARQSTSCAEFVPQSSNMSTYFANFDPTSQFQNMPLQQGIVNNLPKAKTEACRRQEKPIARISLVATGNGNYKAIVKKKRKRTMFTTEQVQALEEVYAKKPYITREERQLLVQQLQVNDKSVKIWFQNRRLKHKKGDDGEKEERRSIFERISQVESKIVEKADAFGYVTLDDEIVSELVSVIDDYFTSKVSPVECKTETPTGPIYEPISPASNSDNTCDENEQVWQQRETYDIVQELMEIM